MPRCIPSNEIRVGDIPILLRSSSFHLWVLQAMLLITTYHRMRHNPRPMNSTSLANAIQSGESVFVRIIRGNCGFLWAQNELIICFWAVSASSSCILRHFRVKIRVRICANLNSSDTNTGQILLPRAMFSWIELRFVLVVAKQRASIVNCWIFFYICVYRIL